MITAAVTTRKAIKNILFATDFSVSSGRALPFAVALRDRYKAKFFVAHVVPQEAYLYSRPENLRQVLRETDRYASEALNALASSIKQNGGSCESVLSQGVVPFVLVQFLQRYSIDLAVIGTGSSGGLEKVLLGSVAEALIRDAPCPVLTVGPHVTTEEYAEMRTLLCAIDFSCESVRAAEYVFSLAEECRAHVTLLHVTEEDSIAPAKRELEERLRELIPTDHDLIFAPRILVRQGAPAERILQAASESSADLIAMGVRGAGAFAHAASHFGSIVHTVLSLARCPVLTAGVAQLSKEK